jgi:hypothetical protein
MRCRGTDPPFPPASVYVLPNEKPSKNGQVTELSNSDINTALVVVHHGGQEQAARLMMPRVACDGSVEHRVVADETWQLRNALTSQTGLSP